MAPARHRELQMSDIDRQRANGGEPGTQEPADAHERLLVSRFGCLAGRPSSRYIQALRQGLYAWLQEVETALVAAQNREHRERACVECDQELEGGALVATHPTGVCKDCTERIEEENRLGMAAAQRAKGAGLTPARCDRCERPVMEGVFTCPECRMERVLEHGRHQRIQAAKDDDGGALS
jgi:hypothetical protein